jgi:unsaturated rhamnogalacturonyl hydrolase
VLAAPIGLFAASPNILVLEVADPSLTFPPAGHAYRENGESHRIWRRILETAPDLLVVYGPKAEGLASALSGSGIPTRLVSSRAEVPPLKSTGIPQSQAHREMLQRLARSPRDYSSQLSNQYGQNIENVVYIEAFALWGRLRQGQREQVATLLEPFLSGKKDSLAKPTASHYSGHLLMAEFARTTGDKRGNELALKAARVAMEQPLDNEMSDSVFMICPLLAIAAPLTGDSDTYARAAAAHFDRMEKLCRRPDGVWRHSPLNDAAWGRGNAFPLLGLALALSYLPANDPSKAHLLSAFVGLAETLVPLQDAAGLWHQVIDRSESYAEFSATAMIAFALERGMRQRWLPRRKYSSVVDRAWTAVKRRTSLKGELVDVCESTGKQSSVEAYFNREAIFSRDPRGGAMALMLATEL